MGAKIFKNLLVILSFTAFTASWLAVIAAAKPLEPNPDWEHWPAGTLWGAELSLENAYTDVYFGAKTGAEHVYLLPPAPVPPWIKLSLVQDTTEYAEITRTQDTPPQSYTWYVMFQSSAAQTGLTISAELENATHWFVPQDHSVILENQAQGIGPFNLRVENGSIDLSAWVPKYATLYVDNAVNVTISPSYQEGTIGEGLTYTVTVQNTGRYDDNYVLENSDELGWELSLDNEVLQVPAGENRTTILHVSIDNCASDVVTVTANGVYASDSDSATATVPPHAVELTVEPTYQSADNWLEYTVVVHNIGSLSDNYDMEVTDDLGWGDNVYLDNVKLENIGPCENKQTTLHVHIPYSVEGGTEDNITVTATSQDNNTVSDNNSCIAHVAIVRGVEISISPNYDNGVPSTTLDYTVTVTNTGNADDTYDLSVSDNAGWGDNIWLEDNSLWVAYGGENSTTLHVHVPYCVEGGTEDNITVTATSQADNMVSDNNSSIAHVAIVRGVEISISPSYQGGLPTGTLNYTVTVSNTGNVTDIYLLENFDNAGWVLSLDNDSLSIPACENRTTTLHVTIPENAEPGTLDNITTIATSQADPLITAENNCTAVAFAEFTLDLIAGWNLVSFPLASESDTPDNIFAGQTYYIWKWYAVNKIYVSPSPTAPVEIGVGYWVYVEENMTAATSGIPVENYSIDLITGWNLVGFPVTNENTTPDNIFAGQTYYIWEWDAIAKKYVSPLSDVPVELGVGYWIWVDHDKTVTVPL